MAIHKAKDALKQIMKAEGLIQRDLALAFGVTGAYVSMLVGGKRDLRVALLARHIGQLGWEIHIAPKPKVEDQVERREFLTAAASVTFIPSPSTSPFQNPEYVRGLAKRLSGSLDHLGGVSLAPTALRLTGNVKRVAWDGGKELQAAASDLARAASRVLRDAQQDRAAEDVGSFGLALARRAGHTYGVAHSYENMSVFTQRSDPAKAAHLAQVGLSFPDLAPEGHVRLNARLATALARNSRSGKAAEKLTRDAIENAHAADDFSVETRAVALGSAGQSYARLRRFEDANSAYDQAVALFAPQPLLAVDWRLGQILATLRSGELDRAARQMNAVSGIVPLVNSARVDRKVAEVLRFSGQWNGVPEIRDARECLRAAAGPLPSTPA